MRNELKATRAPADADRTRYTQKTEKLLAQLRSQQQKIAARREHGVLVVLQGMDASGKDGVVKNIFTRLHPAHCSITAFRAPDATDRSYDFLRRCHLHTPPHGMVQVFNRSYYEDILWPEVHGLIRKDALKRRYMYINTFESLLQEHGTLLFKFFLCISKSEQQERLRGRHDTPSKHWKHDEKDAVEARLWDRYMSSYSGILGKCDKPAWMVIPSDQKWYRDYCIARALTEGLDRALR
jgi:PPK2 family polyphosphate:nucleotide phosphotransferase